MNNSCFNWSVVFLFFVFQVNGQDRPVADSYDLKIIPPSPNAAVFQKYGDIPVSYYTGVPSIEIPLYQITDKEISIPVSLSYHAGGIRAGEISGPVGLGWALQCGGVISQVIKDKNDFVDNLQLPEITEKLSKNFIRLNSVTPISKFYGNSGTPYDVFGLYAQMASYDTEIDVFNFSFGGKSGRFIIDQAGHAVLDKYADIEITPHIVGYVCDRFTIRDEHGVVYLFQDVESDMATNQITSWYLTSITSPSGASVTYQYLPSTVFGNPYKNEVESVGCDNGRYTITESVARQYTMLQVSRIDFKGGYVQMNYDLLREDQLGGKRMNALEIYKTSNTTTPVKRYELTYSHFNQGTSLPNSKRLRLDQIVERGGADALPPYVFNYRTTNLNGNGQNIIDFPYDTKAIDHWGFYNGKLSNSTLLSPYNGPRFSMVSGVTEYEQFAGADKEVDPNYAQAFALTDITYPTGGKTLFEFESNTFDENKSHNGYYSNYNQQIVLEDKSVQFSAFNPGTTIGNFDCSDKVGLPVQVFITFRASDEAALNALHASSNISATTLGMTVSMTNTGLNCPSGQQGSPVCTYTFTLNKANGIYPWEVFIGNHTGFQDVTIKFQWKVAKTLNPPTVSGVSSYNYAGGLRVKKITNVDAGGVVATVRKYDYHYTQVVGGVEYSYSWGRRMSPLLYFRYEQTTQSTLPPGASDDGLPHLVNCLNFVRYANNLGALSTSAQGNIVGYDVVTEYITSSSDPTKTLGKTEYEYENLSDEVFDYPLEVGVMWSTRLPYRKPGMTNLGSGKNGLLKSKTDYAYVNSQFVVVKKSTNNYQTVDEKFYHSLAWENFPSMVATGTALELALFAYPALHAEKILLLSTTEQNAEVTTTQTHTYGSTHHIFPTQTDMSRSDGRVTTVKKYYTPDDYPGLTATQLTAKTTMINQHILSAEIVTESTIGTSVDAVKRNYKLFNATMPLLESIETKRNTSAFDLRFQYLNYDGDGNLRGQAKPNDSPSSYVWGYDNTSVIAEVKNAYPDQIFHTSFEDNGNSTLGDAKTGIKSQTGGYTVTLNTLTPGNYVLTWWLKSGTWQLQTQPISVPGTSYTINLSGQVDEIRFYPVGAVMSTYTYEPLVGVKSVMDANHQLSTYKYDNFSRLEWIKDNDGNVLKSFSYHYKD